MELIEEELPVEDEEEGPADHKNSFAESDKDDDVVLNGHESSPAIDDQ